MKLMIFFLSMAFLGVWLAFNLYLLGYISIDGFESNLTLPKNTAELGDSLGVLNGLLSAIAVIFALIAILLQGKELKESTKAQNLQAKALTDQLKQQAISHRLNVLAIRLQYLRSEIDRMQQIIKSVDGDKDQAKLFNNCVLKKKRYLDESEKINREMESSM